MIGPKEGVEKKSLTIFFFLGVGDNFITTDKGTNEGGSLLPHSFLSFFSYLPLTTTIIIIITIIIE